MFRKDKVAKHDKHMLSLCRDDKVITQSIIRRSFMVESHSTQRSCQQIFCMRSRTHGSQSDSKRLKATRMDSKHQRLHARKPVKMSWRDHSSLQFYIFINYKRHEWREVSQRHKCLCYTSNTVISRDYGGVEFGDVVVDCCRFLRLATRYLTTSVSFLFDFANYETL
jgi:hypothetical protein